MAKGDPNCANSIETIAKSLKGNYREEHLTTLKFSLELYDYYGEKIKEVDEKIESLYKKLTCKIKIPPDIKLKKPKRKRKNSPF